MAEQTIPRKLEEAILNRNIPSTNFFNGRILTAGDLKTEQNACHSRQAQFGRAIGEGVICGLEVTLSEAGALEKPPVLAVSGGSALNRYGQILELVEDQTQVCLGVQPLKTSGPADAFAPCDSISPVQMGEGVYLFMISPAFGYSDEKAPMKGFQTEGCGNKYSFEGLKFRLEKIPLDDLADQVTSGSVQVKGLAGKTDKPSVSLLRSWLAYLCFGNEKWVDVVDDPFKLKPFTNTPASSFSSYGLLDALRDQNSPLLDEWDVPLALVYWPGVKVQFVDMWTVRRRPVRPTASQPWPLFTAQRRIAEAEAMFLQFQAHVSDLITEGDMSAVNAGGRLRFLPPAGFLPTGPKEFQRDEFFKDVSWHPGEADIAFLRRLIHDSWFIEPIDLYDEPKVRIYESAQMPGYLLFVRAEKEPELLSSADEPMSEEPSPVSQPGSIEIDLVASIKDLEGTFGKLNLKSEKSLPSKARIDVLSNQIRISVKDEAANTYPVKFVSIETALPGISKRDLYFIKIKDTMVAIFKTGSVPAGDYTVEVDVAGFQVATQAKAVAEARRTRFTFNLVLKKSPTGTKPPNTTGGGVDGRWIEDYPIERIYALKKLVKYPWPPKEKEWIRVDPLWDPLPEEVLAWAEGIAESIRGMGPVDPGEAHFFIDSAYEPGVVAEQEYAYLVFGKNGAYVPLILTTTDLTLENGVSLDRAGLNSFDMLTTLKAYELGLNSIEQIAHLWTEAGGDLFDMAPEMTFSIIKDAVGMTAGLQGSLKQLPGLDSITEDALIKIGVNGTREMANRDADELTQALKDAGLNITFEFVEGLIASARKIVDAKEWNLGAAGFTSSQVHRLEAAGITTIGQLKGEAAEDPAGVGRLLGISTDEVSAAMASIKTQSTTDFAGDCKNKAPVSRVVGGGAVARGLKALGIATVADLALADETAIKGVFGGNVESAAIVIQDAKRFTGL